MNKTWPQRIGEILAHIQDLLDTIIHTLLKRGKESYDEQDTTKKIMRFFSELGDSYFRKYTEIKKKKD